MSKPLSVSGCILALHMCAATVHPSVREPMVFPKETRPSIAGQTPQEFARKWRDGGQREVDYASRILKLARRWVEKPDTYWIERVSPTTPLGMWTLACPVHPFRVRDFATKLKWRMDDPWKFICPLCEKEGRKYPYYPNPDFPDDGNGCRPTDDAWRRHHDAEWSRKNRGRPWDHWDGKVHGYCESNAYFFRGKWAHLCMYEVSRRTLRRLSQAYLIGRFCYPADSRERHIGGRAARTVKVILLTYARAFLGDGYLAAVTGMSENEHRARLRALYSVEPDRIQSFEGYLPYQITADLLYTDPGFPRKGGRHDMFGGGSQYGRANAYGWTRALAEIRSSFTPEDESNVLPLIARVLSAQPGDEARLRQHPEKPRLRYGILDYMPSPYRMWTHGNLCGMPFTTQFELGAVLNDRKITDALIRNVELFLHNYFWGDGVGWEGSPHYSNVAINNLHRFVSGFTGYRGHYDETHPMWDPRLDGLNPYRHPAYAEMAWKQALTTLPNGCKIAWEDAVAHAVPHLDAVQRALTAGREMPECYAAWYAWEGSGRSAKIKGVQTDHLPSWVFHHSRKVLLRAGAGGSETIASLNFSWNVGHWHHASQDLTLFAGGHEMLSDLGYLGAMATLTKEWIRQPEAHQTVVVRDRQGKAAPSISQRGELIGFASDGLLGYAETTELAAARLALLGEGGSYGRAIFLVPLPQGGQYVFDLFRVRGGERHEWYAHFGQEDVAIEGVELAATGQSLADVLGAKSPPTRHVRDVQRGKTDGPIAVNARGCVTWDEKSAKHVDAAAGIRTVVLGAPGAEIFVGEAPGQRHTHGYDVQARLRVLCLRRKAAPSVDSFAAVHEPFRDRPKLLEITQASVESAEEGCFAAVLKHEAGADWLMSAPHTLDCADPAKLPAHVARVGSKTVEWAGQAAFVRFDSGGNPVAARLFGPGFVHAEGAAIRGPASWRGKLVAFDDEANTLDVVAEAEPVETHQEAPILFVRHAQGASTYSLDRIESRDGSRYRIYLADAPHLAINYLEANRVHEGRIVVEPPPNLPRSAGPKDLLHLGLHVYVKDDGKHRWLGAIAERKGLTQRDAFGQKLTSPESTIKLVPACPDLNKGDALAVTRLRPGEDTVVIPTWVGATLDP